jgi:leucyl aminopeptidase
MQITGIDKSAQQWKGDTLAIGLLEGATYPALDQRLGGLLSEVLAENKFEGKVNSSLNFRVAGIEGIKQIIVIGLGKELSLDIIRNSGSLIARSAKSAKSKTLAIDLPIVGEDLHKSAQAIAEGILLALHQDNRFKSEPDKNEGQLDSIVLLGLKDTQEAIKRAGIIVDGVILARELVAAPANIVNPITMAQTAEALAKDYGLKLQILEEKDCERLGMGAFLGVAKASDLPPKFVHLTYSPSTTPKKKVAIVGKSLTFDSGGLNIKGVGSGIETMKMDMGGGAATLGAAKVIAQLKPDVEVHFICAITENMISGHAMHPGDILTASNGKTIEINNTDAEGRLTLADALVYAEKLEVDSIVDLATLTGACVVALGDDIGGLWSTDENLTNQLQESSRQAGEKFWLMPLEEKYFEGMKSSIADMKNTGPRTGGSITAALFLKQFIQKTPWAHMDIAGPVWADKANGVNNTGATGYPVRTLVNWILNLS